MNKTIMIFAFAAFAFLNACQAGNRQSTGTTGVTTVAPAAFSKQLSAANTGQLVDVRTPEEFAEGHLAGAVNIDYRNSNFEENIAHLKKDKPVFVYCRSGGRSSSAVQKMKDLGFAEVYNLDGGITAWQDAGLPVTR